MVSRFACSFLAYLKLVERFKDKLIVKVINQYR